MMTVKVMNPRGFMVYDSLIFYLLKIKKVDLQSLLPLYFQALFFNGPHDAFIGKVTDGADKDYMP